jgi:hypothetical protein
VHHEHAEGPSLGTVDRRVDLHAQRVNAGHAGDEDGRENERNENHLPHGEEIVKTFAAGRRWVLRIHAFVL